MKQHWEITSEEFETIKLAIENILGMWQYDFIEANDGDGRSTSMSKKTFFEGLKGEFIIKN